MNDYNNKLYKFYQIYSQIIEDKYVIKFFQAGANVKFRMRTNIKYLRKLKTN